MRKSAWLTAGLFIFLIGLISAPDPTPAQVTAIKAGRLIDPASGSTATNQVILVEGSKIKAVGTDLNIPPGSTVIDLSNSAVLPGLFLHAGLAWWLFEATCRRLRG